MEKIRNSSLLRGLCYILIPITVFILLMSIANEVLTSEYGEFGNEKELIQTEYFANSYFSKIISNIINIQSLEKVSANNTQARARYYYFTKIEDTKEDIYYEGTSASRGYISEGTRYIIKNKENGRIYTNLKIAEVETQIEQMKNSPIHWYYADGRITTNIEKLNQDNLKYIYSAYGDRYNPETTNEYNMSNYEQYEIYTTFDTDIITNDQEFILMQKINNLFKNYKNSSMYCIPICTVLFVAIIIYLFWSIGHEKEKEGITLGSIDKIPYELLIIAGGFIIFILAEIVVSISSSWAEIPINITTSVYILSYIGAYASLLAICVTTIRRIKAKEFWHSFLTYKIWHKIKTTTQKIAKNFVDKTKSTKKLTFYYLSFLAICTILISMSGTFLGVLLLLGFLGWTFYKMLEYSKKINKIQEALQDIYEGKNDVYLNEEELQGVLKQMAKYINDIAGGFSNAIEQSLKSERLKTELITNVSHDIKTPLTSIINYVDLLKKEEFENKQIEQYIAILDAKSQRLKKLIEDLVEASKVSSGNVKLNIETINLKELINQTTGEFEDRFEKKNLKIEMSMPEEDVTLQADNRYMYRIIENLFSNITKYAMDGTRVYIELKKQKTEIELNIKNISSEKLNISADELMQRFVRGDKARYTEGSGLGLSIARSLTELQGGRFLVEIDGDLYKVCLKW